MKGAIAIRMMTCGDFVHPFVQDRQYAVRTNELARRLSDEEATFVAGRRVDVLEAEGGV